jgi:precorrin-2 dehydrogenase / sirohydrochlorin ferrochelatase
MAYYPIAVDIREKNVLVVGGGTVALRKIETLLEFGAKVTVISPEVVSGIVSLAADGKVELHLRSYRTGDIGTAALVIAATDDRDVNALVSKDAQASNILVNVVDDPELCSFIVQATVKRGDMVISIGTGGNSPALSRRVREKIEETFGQEYGELTAIMGEVRELARTLIGDQPTRETAFKRILDSDVLDLIKAGRTGDARHEASRILNESADGGCRE